MGRKLYQETPQGGIKFTSHRMGQVRIENYVYDIWLPILGAKGIAVYSVYCRLERQGIVKAISQADLAKACRIGTGTLKEINRQLEECGFIKITEPTGHRRLMHWTTEIEVFKPPKEVSPEILEKYQHPQGYQVLSTWLVESPEKPSSPGETHQSPDETPASPAKVVSLGLNPLDVEGKAPVKKLKPPRDFLGDVFNHATKEQAKEKRPPGWEGTTEQEFGICQRVADLWRGGILPGGQYGDRIERQCAGAGELLRYHDGDYQATLMTVDAYHQHYAGDDRLSFSVAGPQSLIGVIPQFLTEWQHPDKPKVTYVAV